MREVRADWLHPINTTSGNSHMLAVGDTVIRDPNTCSSVGTERPGSWPREAFWVAMEGRGVHQRAARHFRDKRLHANFARLRDAGSRHSAPEGSFSPRGSCHVGTGLRRKLKAMGGLVDGTVY